MSIDSGSAMIALLVAKAGVVVLIAWGATRMLAGTHASRRHAVWATALVVLLTLPVLSLSGRTVGVPLPILRSTPVPTTPGRDTPHLASKNASKVTATSNITTRAPERRIPWSAIAWACYAAGVLAVLVRLAAGLRRANGIAHRAAPADLHRQWRAALIALTGPRTPTNATVLTSTEVFSPVTFGLFRPVVLLPDDVRAWSDRQRRDALVHEFAHLNRFDWMFQIAGVVACAVHWFNPLVWTAARNLALEAERACDERVLALGSSPHDYAEQLVALSREHLGMTIAMSRESCLANRVQSILAYRRTTMRSTPVLTFAAVIITAGCLFLAPLVPVNAAQHTSTRQVEGLSPLMKAAMEGSVVDVSHAIENGADVNRAETRTQRDHMRTPLTAAARAGHRDVVELLLDHGARIDAAPRGDATALMEAAKNNHEDVVALLIERGADVTVDITGDGNAIIAAARGGNVNIARLVVGAGADVNAGVPGDGNALIIAVQGGDRKMVEYLLSQGADPTAYVPGDESALVAAAQTGDGELLRLLLGADKGERPRG